MLFFYVHVTRKSCQNATFVQKICTFNVDEIDSCKQIGKWSWKNERKTLEKKLFFSVEILHSKEIKIQFIVRQLSLNC